MAPRKSVFKTSHVTYQSPICDHVSTSLCLCLSFCLKRNIFGQNSSIMVATKRQADFQSVIKCSKLTIKALEQGVQYAGS